MTTLQTDYAKILAWIDKSDFNRSEVLIALKIDEAEREAPAARGKLQTEDYATIITKLIEGVPAKVLASDFKVSAARISEIRREKSIPVSALKGYLEAKAAATAANE